MTKIALIIDIHNELLRKAGRPVPDIQIDEAVNIRYIYG
jgi:hypothetical protein